MSESQDSQPKVVVTQKDRDLAQKWYPRDSGVWDDDEVELLKALGHL